ncbi:hypothetical protein [Liquorilactobacillus nagelii]|uniref:hypothetical protein n=1 Tax=Liquorilactobacillus nagelii TaxID=82688 RepID=UPI0039E80C82
MEKKEKIVLINKKPVTDELLYKNACDLTNISQELQAVTDLLEMVGYFASKKDTFAIDYFITQGKLDNATDVLQNIQHDISDISTAICPDND